MLPTADNRHCASPIFELAPGTCLATLHELSQSPELHVNLRLSHDCLSSLNPSTALHAHLHYIPVTAMASAGTKRRSVRQAATRKRSVYVDPDTDDDFEAEGEDDYEPDPEPAQAPPQKRHKGAPRTRHITRSKSTIRSRSKSVAKPGLKGVGRKRRWNFLNEAPKKEFKGPSDGKIPDWALLPVEILRDIFVYASQPLHVQTPTSTDNVNWLMRVARICHAFGLPALEAYYLSPALLTSYWPHAILALLKKPKEERYMDYNVKVKALSIHIHQVAYTAHNRPLFDLSTLVAELPQLQHLEVLHPVDEPPFRPVKGAPWFYPPALFDTLAEHGQRLRSFRWNRDMIKASATEVYGIMAQTHLSKPFEYLERLTVCGFDYNDSAEPLPPEDGSEIAAPGLATSIALLPSLKYLTFISCDVLMDKFLERLPKNLEHLELTNCLELTSDMLQTYLATGGSQLRELVLNHNTSLNLGFLPGLKVSCPKLEVLKMDLRYYSERMNSNDADPLYDDLLTATEIPTWPSTLRHLELEHLQKCPAEAAENLFRSLVDSAEDLPVLRYLVIQAHINIPWRDRAGFRDQWIGRLLRVYSRVEEPPNPYLGSLRQFRLWKQAKAAGRATPPPDQMPWEESDDDFEAHRRLSHVQISPAKPHDGDTDVYSDSSPEKLQSQSQPARRSRRVLEASQQAAIAASQSASPAAGDSPSDDEEEGNEENWRKEPEKFIQGLCTVVDIRIDNQRPRENQFTEGDFLDAEASGDEDWHEGADEEEGEGSYAW